MSKMNVTNFDNRTGSPFRKNGDQQVEVQEVVLQKTNQDIQKKNNELLQKANKITAVYQSHKPSSGYFTEVVTHGAFTAKKEKEVSPKPEVNANSKTNKSPLGFPSSANDLALDAKTDLESDPNISKEVKDKVIQKLFALVSMVQHTYESKVRIMTEFDKYKDSHYKNEIRREREHSEQLYKLNMNFQNEVIQSIQQLKSEMDLTKISTQDEASGLRNVSIGYDSGSSQTFDSHRNTDGND